jgi:DNA-binding IclR family transcriptional regulator
MAAVKTLDSVDALNRILDIATAFWKSQTFFTACQLGVFETLGEAPATPEDLAQRLGVNPLACRRLLVPLRELGLVEQHADQFRNSELGSFCTSTSPVPLEAASLWGRWHAVLSHVGVPARCRARAQTALATARCS